MSLHRSAHLAALAWIAASLSLETLPAGAQAAPADVQIEELELANGMRFLLVERHQSPTVACIIAVGVGGADEPRDRTGMAHLLEHLLFKGSDRLGTADYGAEKRSLAAIEKTVDAMDAEQRRLEDFHRSPTSPDTAAARIEHLELEAELTRLEAEMRRHVIKNEIWGLYDRHGGAIQNAFTTEDRTVYYVVLPANKLEVWARIESERMTRSVLREFYSERNVVQEERRRSRESTPGGLIGEALLSTAFTSHPYKNPVIGWMSDLRHLRRADVLDFYHTYYQPSNMVGLLVGDFDPAEARRLIEQNFGRLDSKPVVRPRRAEEPPMSGMRERIVEFDAQPELRLAFRIPDVSHPDFPALDVLATLLGSGRTSRLRQELLLKKQAVRVAAAGVQHTRDPRLLEVSLQPLAGKTVEQVEAMAWEEIRRLSKEPAPADELAGVRTRMRADVVYLQESNLSFGLWLSANQMLEGDWREGYRYFDRVDRVTAGDVMRVAGTYLKPQNSIRIELKPTGESSRIAGAAGGGAKTP
jgi:predicted Zn-dependent peptidase